MGGAGVYCTKYWINVMLLARKQAKCVVWDLDCTLWQGTLLEGDDIVLKEGIKEIVTGLDERGVLQSIASKNNLNDAIAKLRDFGLDKYFLYPQINWNAKSSSITKIREKLNIGIDTFIFIDDQAFERDEVNSQLPEVECLDAEDYHTLLQHPRIADIQITKDSGLRRQRYLEDSLREKDMAAYSGPTEEFLSGLNMKFSIAPAVKDDLARAEELTERTNQLNSTGITYSRHELEAFMLSDSYELLICELEDRYGSYGKIGLVLVEKQENSDVIKLLLMSCRTASRGVGGLVLNHLMNNAKRHGRGLLAEFKRTKKNRQMLMTYQFANFMEIEKCHDGSILFENDLSTIPPIPAYITLHVGT